MAITRKGFFFSLDALIGIAIVLLIILMAYPLIYYEKPQTTLHYDVIHTLSTLRVATINNTYVEALILNGQINDTNKSILEQIGEFYVTNTTLAREFASNVLADLPEQQNIGIWYGSTLIASVNETPYENAARVSTARQEITGIKDGESVTGFSSRAYLTQATQTRYTYFGGYVGDGNVTVFIPYSGSVTSAQIEVATTSNFTIYVNDVSIGTYNGSSSEFTPVVYTLPLGQFQSTNNTVSLRATNLHISGGFVKLTYDDALPYQDTRQYLSGVEGIVNVYDGLSTSGTLQALELYLHYESNYTLQAVIGNVTVFNASSAGETTTTVTNAQLDALLDYNELSNATVPVRIGLAELFINGTGGNADVVLITDVSGSMDWRLDSDTSGTARSCNNSQLYAASTKRISLAKCLDLDFVTTVLAAGGNRIALVSFSSDANTYLNLTTNFTLLNTTIMAYTASGGTCLSCAINRAYSILSTSNITRKKFVVTMTDGVATTRSTPACIDIYGEGAFGTTLFGVGESGGILRQLQNNSWKMILSNTTSQLNDIDFINSTKGFAVGSSGTIVSWNGTTWTSVSSPVNSAIHSVDMYNTTLGFAVGASGRVLKWNGTAWSLNSTISNSPTLYGVSALNSTLLFAAGTRSSDGRIYRSTNGGSSWTELYSDSNDVYDIKIFNTTRGYAVGQNGLLIQYNGTTWNEINSPTNEDLYSVEIYNATYAFAAGGDSGSSTIIRSLGGAWSEVYSSSEDTLRDLVVWNTSIHAVGLGGVVVVYNGTTWQRSFAVLPAYQGNSTSGFSCTSDGSSCSETNSFPALNANYSSCRVHDELNATVYSIGFGPVSTCGFASQTLSSIAQCGNGTYYSSSNGTLLQEFYTNIANDILRLAYSEQVSEATGNISAILYPDSYIDVTYQANELPYGLLLSIEQPFSDASKGSFTLPNESRIADARVTSYSGPRWTVSVLANNISAYNLTKYGSSYPTLGDPYSISIPTSLIGNATTVSLTTGISPQNTTSGSQSNKIVYTIAKNFSSYSPIVAKAEGCIWTIEFDGGTNGTIVVPSSYGGSNICTFNPNTQTYNTQDAFDVATYDLLRLLDLDGDGRVDISLSASAISVDASEVEGIPYTWSTEVQVRTWD